MRNLWLLPVTAFAILASPALAHSPVSLRLAGGFGFSGASTGAIGSHHGHAYSAGGSIASGQGFGGSTSTAPHQGVTYASGSAGSQSGSLSVVSGNGSAFNTTSGAAYGVGIGFGW